MRAHYLVLRKSRIRSRPRLELNTTQAQERELEGKKKECSPFLEQEVIRKPTELKEEGTFSLDHIPKCLHRSNV